MPAQYLWPLGFCGAILVGCGPGGVSARSPARPTAWESQEYKASTRWEALERAVVDPDAYSLIELPTAALDDLMRAGAAAQGIPASLQGIWWMDGNPLAAGNAFSFAETLWDFPEHRVLIQEYGENNYTYDADDAGRASFAATVADNLNFEVQFDAAYTFGRLVQVKNGEKASIVDVNYTMRLLGAGDWLRTSAWGSRALPDYHLRRIVDGAGRRVEPTYSEFLKVAPERSLLPIRKQKSGQPSFKRF